MSLKNGSPKAPGSDSLVERRSSRRSILGMSLALGAGAAGLEAGQANAAAHSHAEHSGSMGSTSMSMVDVAANCIAMGEKCHAHGLAVISTGDTSLADCNRAVSIMISVCHAVARMAALDSERLPDIVAVAMHTCDDCRIECEKHAADHPECKACADACATLLNAMKPA